jgi:hypothetical protein
VIPLRLPQGSAAAFVVHDEPANALSIPTWAIHVSSLVEWLVAMGLVWQYADVCGNPKWKGLTWGMLPLHTSGICACTYHFFYNSEGVEWLVALQVRRLHARVLGLRSCAVCTVKGLEVAHAAERGWSCLAAAGGVPKQPGRVSRHTQVRCRSQNRAFA